ncbi:LacI family DNA-binding transcriptional regulator [Nakamurella alba]|uniref:LacI family DNA-binding transcriptional regulator n=1 Tax=Nakamurella alba TaxID=2665158 RepID=UPI0018ABBB9F|nr:LacI family DNA-binding transcriptional regulator [Nakamurella alba]
MTRTVPRSTPHKRATMADVAALAGVGLKTVSRYVNGETNIAPDISARIGEAISALNFRRNFAAASIRPGRHSELIALIIEDIANPFYSALTGAIENALRDEGFVLIVASSEEDTARHTQLVEQFLERRVDGLIIVPPRDPGPQWVRLADEIPALVLLDRPDPQVTADTIVADDRAGGRLATELLLEGGSRRIAFVGESLDLVSVAARHRGYQDALRAAGLTPDPALRLAGDRSADAVSRTVHRLLAADPTIDGLFGSNNRSAVGILGALRELGEQRAVVGFDDFEAATLVSPQLTVVTHDLAEMGRRAADLVLRRIRGDDTEPQHVTLPVTAIRRGSDRIRPQEK